MKRVVIPSPAELLEEIVAKEIEDLQAQLKKDPDGEASISIGSWQQVVIDHIKSAFPDDFVVQLTFVGSERVMKVSKHKIVDGEEAAVQDLLKRCLKKIRDSAYRTERTGWVGQIEVAYQLADTESVRNKVAAELKQRGWLAEVDGDWLSISPISDK